MSYHNKFVIMAKPDLFETSSSSSRTSMRPVDDAIGLELSTKLRQEGQALLFASQLQQIRSLVGNGCSSSGHLKDLFLLGFPGNDIEFFLLQSPDL